VLFVGTLIGSTNSDHTACFRLHTDDRASGADTTGIPIIWPPGYSARTNPLRVVDDKQQTVGVSGSNVRLGGGWNYSRSRILGCGEAEKTIVA